MFFEWIRQCVYFVMTEGMWYPLIPTGSACTYIHLLNYCQKWEYMKMCRSKQGKNTRNLILHNVFWSGHTHVHKIEPDIYYSDDFSIFDFFFMTRLLNLDYNMGMGIIRCTGSFILENFAIIYRHGSVKGSAMLNEISLFILPLLRGVVIYNFFGTVPNYTNHNFCKVHWQLHTI
jgi:hypothetical protein